MFLTSILSLIKITENGKYLSAFYLISVYLTYKGSINKCCLKLSDAGRYNLTKLVNFKSKSGSIARTGVVVIVSVVVVGSSVIRLSSARLAIGV